MRCGHVRLLGMHAARQVAGSRRRGSRVSARSRQPLLRLHLRLRVRRSSSVRRGSSRRKAVCNVRGAS
jgi:hypothetical protein